MPRKNQRLKQPLAEEKISHSKKSNSAKETGTNNIDENPKNIVENESEINGDITSEDKFACSICDQMFKYESGLRKHEQRHKSPGGFVCSECDERFITDAERSIHRENCHKTFKCLICGENCASEEAFTEHINTLHEGRDRKFVTCEDCGAQFRQKNQLKLHNESKCGTVRSYECNQCNSKFMTQNTLNSHLLIHTGEKKHLCKFCGNSFLSKGQLKIHERSHTKEKPYKCLVCNKAFAHRESLVTHSSIHTGIKPYQCQCCNTQFSCIGNLIKHRRIRPQTCGLPKYTNAKCAPRASTKVPGTLTLKKENQNKRSNSKQKIMTVPELLSVRTELTSQKVATKTEIEQNNEEEFLILSKQERAEEEEENELNVHIEKQPELKIEPVPQEIEFIDQKVLNAPSSGTISYNIPKNGVLVVTADGNYVITSLGSNLLKNTNEPKVLQPQVEQIIILNGNDLQFTNMEIDSQDNERTKSHDKLLTENLISTIDDEQTDEIMDEPYNSIQQLEIVPADDEHDRALAQREAVSQVIEIFQCEICEKQFKLEKSLIKHLSSKHDIEFESDKKQSFKCKHCDKQYSTDKLLDKHMQCHGANGDLVHKCSCCPMYFESKDKMIEHAQKEHEDRLKCEYCQKIYKDVDCKAAHIRKLHTKTGAPQKKYTFVCSKCGKKFNSRVALSDHEQADCGRSPIYKCTFDNCGKSLHSLGSLKIHQLIHTGDLPYSCNFCKKKFRTHGQVKVHERSHSGEKPFKCNECPKAFAHRESLLTHLSLHTGLKRFACQGCDARFSCISNLQAHRRTHQTSCGQLPLDTKAQYAYNVGDGSVLGGEMITSD